MEMYKAECIKHGNVQSCMYKTRKCTKLNVQNMEMYKAECIKHGMYKAECNV